MLAGAGETIITLEAVTHSTFTVCSLLLQLATVREACLSMIPFIQAGQLHVQVSNCQLLHPLGTSFTVTAHV